ncbi:unnamed protein product [Aphanomyces euteiches]|uniref:Glycoside hydrolase family 5 domain-containing protein n=1 Tax=Aphanomyces euteiches TaxID=100861 RepID=A0A6G0W5C4_9STRA|nr:hypothetical protein Ae201684_018522 [Aphanomyces euteiches]KAH9076248.1 hypothetical protein Ae201684P_012736 [Aphanomyces euteiches]KAH9146083.1 hypothetical protein AeRB84_010026 [Aphanomyces euteiches]
MASSPERSSTTPSSTADEAEATTNYFAIKEVNTGPRESSFSYSFQYPSSTRGNPFARGSIIDRSIVAVPEEVALEINAKRRKAPQYNGRIKRWRGAMLLFIVIVIAAGAITYFSVQSNTAAAKRRREVQQRIADRARIESGLENANSPGSKNDEESEDGVVNNPKVYKAMGCELPNYVSKQGKIWAVSKNGTEVPVGIKGVNWFGMETGMQAPFGLWDNEQNGTTVYAIADFLQKNKFNSVRVPLCVQNILENKPLVANIVNRVTNRALDLSSYMSLLQSIVKGLGYRQVSVLISMHTLDRMNAAGSLWYGKGYTEKDFFTAIDMLTKALCSDEYWNVVGIDVKNEPWEGTWGTGLANDFKVGAEKIANRMLQGCPKWMAFVEGVNAQHTIVLDEQEFGYYDWFGGGLHKAKDFPPKFSVDNKLVYAPHYYTPAVFPQYYLYGGGTVGKGNVINDYIELTTSKLYGRVKNTMYDMFGFLVEDKGPAVLLGEFGGLYTYDAHPQKTTQRCTDSTVRVIVEEGYAGGYMWSLNPESAYQYNPSDTAGNFVEGLLQIDWRKANAPFLKAMQGLDKLTDLKPMPCFPIEIP